jgi:5'-nucleotidase (lipoprotein e(P4) family)
MKKTLLFTIAFQCSLCLLAQDSISMKAMHQQTESDLKTYPTLWQQTSAEYRALCYQAFNTAKWQLETELKTKEKNGQWAIVTDLDETILDNSYAEAKLIKEHKEYNSGDWKKWIAQSGATEVPGASQFLQWANQQGVSIFYISNRDTSEINATLINLQKLKLPNADKAHMLFVSNTSSKEARRQIVMEKYKVVMLLGDNLNDFTQLFEKKNIADRKVETDKVREEWGKKFIVLPNSTYGEWENAVYDYDRKLSPQQKEVKRNEKLIGY